MLKVTIGARSLFVVSLGRESNSASGTSNNIELKKGSEEQRGYRDGK